MDNYKIYLSGDYIKFACLRGARKIFVDLVENILGLIYLVFGMVSRNIEYHITGCKNKINLSKVD